MLRIGWGRTMEREVRTIIMQLRQSLRRTYFYYAPTRLQKKEIIKDYAVRQVIWENKKIRPAVTFLIPGYGSASLWLSILFCQIDKKSTI